MIPITRKKIAIWSFALTAVIEIVTVILRFGCELESTRDTASTIGILTCGIRIHHGYIGALIIIIALIGIKAWPAPARWMLVVGTSLLCSDLIHHFLVLWPITGNPQFHLVY